jgi:hypothetical protein
MAKAPSSIGLWVGFVLAGVVYAVLAPLDDPPVDPVRLQLRPVGRAARRLPGDAADADSARPGLRLGGSARPAVPSVVGR